MGEPAGGDLEPSTEGIAATSRREVRDAGLLIVATAVALLVGVTAVVERRWLGGRTGWITALMGAALVALWSRLSLSRRALVAAVLTAVTAAITVTELGRRPEGFADRVLARDIPAAGAYTLPFGLMVVLAACVTLGMFGGESLAAKPGRRRSLVAGGLAALLLVPGVLVAGVGARWAVDRATGSTREHSVTGRAARAIEETAGNRGPTRPRQEVWRFGPQSSPLRWLTTTTAVPGWDVLITVDTTASIDEYRLTAISAEDGTAVWTYEPRGWLTGGVTIDPEAGRVLIVSEDAVVVLSLADGSELRTGQLPDGLVCDALLGDRFLADIIRRHEPVHVEVGPVAVMRCPDPTALDQSGDRLAVIDVADGTVVRQADATADGCIYASVVPPSASSSSPIIGRWGSPWECGPPTFFAFDRSGRLEPISRISPPGSANPAYDYPLAAESRLMLSGGDAIVAVLVWAKPDPGPPDDPQRLNELVTLSINGDVRWRRVADDGRQPEHIDVAIAGEQGVAARWGNRWRLLRLSDGRIVEDLPVLPEDGVAVGSDGARIYTINDRGVVVRRTRDLSPVGIWESDQYLVMGPARLAVAGGRLIVPVVGDDDSQYLVALGDR
jgi:hypothetical protein